MLMSRDTQDALVFVRVIGRALAIVAFDGNLRQFFLEVAATDLPSTSPDDLWHHIGYHKGMILGLFNGGFPISG